MFCRMLLLSHLQQETGESKVMMLVVVPTYNEKANIEELTEKILSYEWLHVLVVDDNSPDGTAEKAEGMQDKYPGRLFLIKRSGKMGLGTAYLEGFRWALARDYEAVFEMDADFSHNPDYLPDFKREIEKGADLVLGSRYVKGGGVMHWGLLRKLISRGGSLYARTILSVDINDLTGGFKCFRRSVLEKIDFSNIKSNGYSFQIEMTYRTLQKGFKVTEIPIIFEDRTLGTSKMSKKIFMEAVFMVWCMRFS